MLERERDRVAAASRQLASSGLVLGTAGNVSERAGDRVAITPSGAALARLEADEVTVIDLSGARVDGPLPPTSELALHLGVYKRYRAGAVVHTHAPVSTALSSVLDEVPAVHGHLRRRARRRPVRARAPRLRIAAGSRQDVTSSRDLTPPRRTGVP